MARWDGAALIPSHPEPWVAAFATRAATQTLRQVGEALVVSLTAPLPPGGYRLD